MKEKIEKIIKDSLLKLDIDFDDKIVLEHPQDLKNGDYTTNIAMVIAGKSKNNPREIAQKILEEINKIISDFKDIEKVEIAGPGYLNFYLSKEFFKKELESDFVKQNFSEKKEKILFEFTSTNLFKPFHIGHMVNNSLGESLSRILKYTNNDVLNITFPSDVSPGIAKTIWALEEQGKNVETLTLQEIADAYVFGSSEYKKEDNAKKKIDDINAELYKSIWEKVPETENIKFYKRGKELSLEHFNEITRKLGSEFSGMIFESEAEKVGKGIVEKNIGNIFKKSQGAIIFEGEHYTNVFINSQGFGTYLTKDIGLFKIKKNLYEEYNKSILVNDIEQKQHTEMVVEVGKKIEEISDFAKKSIYINHGRMNFVGNIKISSRYGNVPLALEVIKKVQENILKKMRERDFLEQEKEEISEKIAIATLKYSTLKVTSGKNISFDIEKDTNPQGNSAPYILYSVVRAKSILRKVENDLKNISNNIKLKSGEISNLEKKFYIFDEVLKKVIDDYSPHHLANYLYDLASEFNLFYAETKILDKDNEDYFYNLDILKRYEEIMEKGFYLLGIKTVEKM